MVRALGSPQRPLGPGAHLWQWRPKPYPASWYWCRIYHRGAHTPDGVTFRTFGPLHRFDHHRQAHPDAPPAVDPDGRAVLYVTDDLDTAASEVFGEAGVAGICPNYRIAIIEPIRALALCDLAGSGAAMAIGALPSLAQGHEPRRRTQEWARAVFAIRVRRDGAGAVQDQPLQHPAMLRRLQVGMRRRRIALTTISTDECPQCP